MTIVFVKCNNIHALHVMILQAIYDSFNSNESRLYANFSSLEMTFAVAIFAIGGMLGALPAGLIADHLGRYNY